MEITTVSSFLDYYTRVRERTNRIVRVIPPEHINWAYKPGKFTVADMLRHIAGIERYLYAEVAQGRPSRYKGCGKELADGYQEVLRYFEELHLQSMEIFSSLQDQDLNR
ncbi:DinB family protein [Pontibacter kalidii]|uniref:DinB family protein n=1 Tax=Pontibacter kalidii TaxID=2592049 RepID=UPI00225969DE|nr:DinB family protein [Pontibacter kalidii]